MQSIVHAIRGQRHVSHVSSLAPGRGLTGRASDRWVTLHATRYYWWRPGYITAYNEEMNNAKVDVLSGLSMDALPVRMAPGGLQMHDG